MAENGPWGAGRYYANESSQVQLTLFPQEKSLMDFW